MQCEPDEASSFTNPNVGPGTYASLRLKLDAGLVPYMGDKGDKSAARPPEGSLVETRCLIKGPKSAIVPFAEPRSGAKSRTDSGVLPTSSACFVWRTRRRVFIEESESIMLGVQYHPYLNLWNVNIYHQTKSYPSFRRNSVGSGTIFSYFQGGLLTQKVTTLNLSHLAFVVDIRKSFSNQKYIHFKKI